MSLNVVKQRLAEVPDKLLEGGEQALIEVADLMAGLAKVGVRVDTGSLRDSIRRERGADSPHRRVMRVRAGGYIINPRTGKMVNYAAAVEQKYPYMRPAWEQVRPQVEEIIRRMCLAQLKTIEEAGVLRFE